MRIGITIGLGDTRFGINRAYVEYVAGAGFEPILITPENDMEAMAEFCDGLLLPGGIDLDPMHYGEDNVASYSVDPEKDEFERQAFRMFGGVYHKPIFGICRGFQLIAREFLQDNPEYCQLYTYWQHVEGHGLANSLQAPRTTPTHYVAGYRQELHGDPEDEGGTSDIPTNSMHHQGLIGHFPGMQPAKQQNLNMLKVLAWTKRGVPAKAKGAVIEAFRINGWNGGSVMAVQWHPEELQDFALIQKFYTEHAGGDIAMEA
jgi:putative glutamine amidotransferase